MNKSLTPRAHTKPRYLRLAPTFMSGVGSALNVFGSFTPMYYGRDPVRADREAMRSDWEMLGQDMEQVFARFEVRHRQELEANGISLIIQRESDH